MRLKVITQRRQNCRACHFTTSTESTVYMVQGLQESKASKTNMDKLLFVGIYCAEESALARLVSPKNELTHTCR